MLPFPRNIDYAQLVKIYGTAPEAEKALQPAELGSRQNRNSRYARSRTHFRPVMSSGRISPCGWVCDGLRVSPMRSSKKLANHTHALSIYFMRYNFVRIHQTLRVTPVMAGWDDGISYGSCPTSCAWWTTGKAKQKSMGSIMSPSIKSSK